MFAYSDEMGGLSNVITTRAGYSSVEIKEKENEYFDKYYKYFYDEYYKAYDEGYRNAYAEVGESYPGLAVAGANAGVIKEIQNRASEQAKVLAQQTVRDENAAMQETERQNREQQKWIAIQKSRMQSAGLVSQVAPQFRRGVLVTQVKGETVIGSKK